MSLRHALLGALADQPRTGYALLKHFEQSLAYAWPASHSQIYPELARLRDEGLIEQTGSGARNSKTYALTDAGLDEIRHWLESTTPDRRVRNDAALRTFFLWLLEPEQAVQQLERERDYSAAMLSEFRRISEEPTGANRKARTFRIALEGGIRNAESRLEWLDWAIEQVRSPEWRSLD
ncbi:MAG TPA: PadR family transcriptional regulator [Gaiellaceae bacterium]|nr:PadR family transcriptional regulator [Gaiellaceae bacterium]